jgi:phospholipid/cholesterol/gamma-HCH transport system ATP-binding protein
MIITKNLNKSFDKHHVLKGIDVEFEKGKTNLIIGQSGSGKTVFMKCISGLYPIDEGEISYDGRILKKLNKKERKNLRKEIGMLFQGGALFDSMNVEDNIMFPLNMFSNMSLQEKKKRVDFCLDWVELGGNNHKLTSELSGGMIKRVAIARAIVLNPKYLFCDEPNSGLDPRTSGVIDELIHRITQEFQITTIVNTHDMNSVLKIGDRINYLYEGKLWWQGDKNSILKTDNQKVNDFVFSMELTKRIKKDEY